MGEVIYFDFFLKYYLRIDDDDTDDTDDTDLFFVIVSERRLLL